MIQRAFIHVAGPAGSGKTAFIEALLREVQTLVLAARCVRDDNLDEAVETAPPDDPELRRYREAGASGEARFTFPAEPEAYDDFFMTDLTAGYSEAVVIEGDNPLGHVDLRVFVAPPLAAGEELFVRLLRDRAAESRAEAEAMERMLHEPGGAERFLVQSFGKAIGEVARKHPRLVEDFRRILLEATREGSEAPPPAPTEHWAISPVHQGIERAQLAVVNVRGHEERTRGERLIAELPRLRKDDALYADVVGRPGFRAPITAVVTNLADPEDRALEKAMARVKRTIRRVSSTGG